MADEQERLRVAFEKFLQFLQADGRSKNESETIAWLIQHMQTAASLPSLSEISRMTGVPRRQLSADRWPRFRRTYDQLAGLERGVDKSRMINAYEDPDDD
jgi:hypothetical protein